MRRSQLHLGLALVTLMATSALPAEQSHSQILDLPLPRKPTPGEAVWLNVGIGELARGARLVISTSEGKPVYSVAPVGPQRSKADYLVPLPAGAIVNGRVRLELAIEQPGEPPRPPHPSELESASVTYVQVTN